MSTPNPETGCLLGGFLYTKKEGTNIQGKTMELNSMDQALLEKFDFTSFFTDGQTRQSRQKTQSSFLGLMEQPA
jgi:hypothetical protein